MEAAVLAELNKDKLNQEILKIGDNKRSSLDTSNLQQDDYIFLHLFNNKKLERLSSNSHRYRRLFLVSLK